MIHTLLYTINVINFLSNKWINMPTLNHLTKYFHECKLQKTKSTYSTSLLVVFTRFLLWTRLWNQHQARCSILKTTHLNWDEMWPFQVWIDLLCFVSLKYASKIDALYQFMIILIMSQIYFTELFNNMCPETRVSSHVCTSASILLNTVTDILLKFNDIFFDWSDELEWQKVVTRISIKKATWSYNSCFIDYTIYIINGFIN